MASGIETTLDKLPMGNSSLYKVRLKCLYVTTKRVKHFHKAHGRLVDRKGNALWFEISGSNATEVMSKSRQVMPGRVNVFKGLLVKTSQWYSGGRVVDLNPRSNVSLTPMAPSHPDVRQFVCVYQPNNKIGDLSTCVAGARVDVIGRVREVRSDTIKHKVEVWLQGEDGVEVLVELWGRTFTSSVMTNSLGVEHVLQVDNARVVKREDGSIHLTAEFYADSEKGNSWIFIDPVHERMRILKEMQPSIDARRISSAWTPSGTMGIVRLTATDGEHYLTCLSTLRVRSLAWAAESTDESQLNVSSLQMISSFALPEKIEVILYGVYLAELPSSFSGGGIVYTECEICRTKIDEATGKCKKSGEHATKSNPVKVVYTPVRLIDYSGSCHDVMINAEALCTFAGVAGVDVLEHVIKTKGVSSLTFQRRCDIHIGANQARKGAPKGTVDDTACQFQVLRVVDCLLAFWNTETRPALSQILCCDSFHPTQIILPIRDPNVDLEYTPAGFKFKHANANVQYVTLLCVTDEPAEVRDINTGDGDFVQMVYGKVFPYRSDDGRQGSSFSVEILCAKEFQESRSLSGTDPRLVVGQVHSPDGSEYNIVAENVFDIQHIENGCDKFEAERAGIWELLIHRVSYLETKRRAKDLVTPTPKKTKVSFAELGA